MNKGILYRLKEYAKLMRFDRPIGILLLLWPTLWGLWFAAAGHPPIKILIIFVIGVVVTRALGCVINDINDRRFDKHVQRTKTRPLAQHSIHLWEAYLIFIILSIIALVLVGLLNRLTILLAIIAFALIAIYPLMKRFVYWPQLFLGLTFGAWPILMGYSAIENRLPWLCLLPAGAVFCWTVAYDTMYAMADKEDDLTIGVKSTAIWFGKYARLWIGLFQAAMITLLVIFGLITHIGFAYYIGLLIAVILFIYEHQLIKSERPEQCFAMFLHSRWVGVIIFVAVVVAYL
ncbi:MAG: 4-hydroxybenzoate octaprenyltransferase [Pseudomonadota bacterium]